MKNWTIKKRIIAGFTVIVTLSAIMGALAWFSMRTIAEHADELAGDSIPGLSLGDDIMQNLSIAHLDLIRHVLSASADEKQKFAAQIKEIAAENTKKLDELQKTCNSPEEKDLFEKVSKAREEYVKARAPILELSDSGKRDEALALLARTAFVSFDAYNKIAMDFNDLESKSSADGANVIQSSAKSSKIILASVVIAEVLISALLAFVVVTGLNRVLRRVSSALGEGAEQVTSAAGQVSGSSQSLAEGASEQAASLEETSSSLEEMASMTKRNSENAQKANDLAKQARNAADKGAADMQTMSQAMADIKVSSDDIAKIIKTIDEIAFQTNILALNAAVEAARAGEAGMGFAVVADEVRNLAQRSAQAAKETAGKIEAAISKTGQGVQISTKVSQTLNEIVTKARQVDELVAEVATASNEQTQGILQINTAVGQMDKVTQSNAANAEESAAAAEELNAQAETMKHSVSELQNLVDGGSESFARPAAMAPVRNGRHSDRTTAPAPTSNGQNGGRRASKTIQTGTTSVPIHGTTASAIANGRNELPMEGDFKDF